MIKISRPLIVIIGGSEISMDKSVKFGNLLFFYATAGQFCQFTLGASVVVANFTLFVRRSEKN
jgi:hypothetical protein